MIEARERFRRVKDYEGEVRALRALGRERAAVAAYGEAQAFFDEALGICRDLAMREPAAGVRVDEALARQRAGDVAGAEASLEAALRIYERVREAHPAASKVRRMMEVLREGRKRRRAEGG